MPQLGKEALSQVARHGARVQKPDSHDAGGLDRGLGVQVRRPVRQHDGRV
jgi:hypothetical protein